MIPEQYRDLLDGAVVVSLVTMMPDGQPQNTPIWCSYDGEYILVNTAVGRRKDKNLSSNPKTTIMAMDPQNPYRWIEVRGEVMARTVEGAVDHINALSKTYRGIADYYQGDEAAKARETRVIFKIKPTKVNAAG